MNSDRINPFKDNTDELNSDDYIPIKEYPKENVVDCITKKNILKIKLKKATSYFFMPCKFKCTRCLLHKMKTNQNCVDKFLIVKKTYLLQKLLK
jgi:hypothetical protein